MFNNPYSFYNPQNDIDKINAQINELEKRRSQIQQPIPITQNFQLAPTRDVIRYANSLEEVNRDVVIGETPYFSKDMSVLWVKNIKGEIKTYELIEIIPKDDKDLQIEFLKAQIEELKKGAIVNEFDADVDEPVESKKSIIALSRRLLQLSLRISTFSSGMVSFTIIAVFTL